LRGIRRRRAKSESPFDILERDATSQYYYVEPEAKAFCLTSYGHNVGNEKYLVDAWMFWRYPGVPIDELMLL